MYHCTSSDHGQSFCLGTQPNSFRDMKTLTPTRHPKLLTALKVPKKKKKKQKDEWNQSPDISDDEDPSLQPKKLYDDAQCFQAAVASAMKSGLRHRLIELLEFPVSPIYKLAVCDRLDFENNTPLPMEVNDVWTERLAADQPLGDLTYHGTHYGYLPNAILSLLQVDGECAHVCIPIADHALAHALTTEELLECPTLATAPEPTDDKLLEMLIFDCNMVKLPQLATLSASQEQTTTTVITASATQINDFLKLVLKSIL
uniref:Uncharacterized protein n=1 Tax=Romanomermis culicivorax TaxID=13658 RepID=A0A915J6I1_ROMCU